MKSINSGLWIIIAAIVLTSCNIFPYVQTETESTISNEAAERPPQPTQTTVAIPTEIQATANTTISPESNQKFDAFILQEGTPFYLPAFSHPDSGCDWLGVAGQVFLPEGVEAIGLMIIVGAEASYDDYLLSAVTGEANAYGSGGYEIELSDLVNENNRILWIQITNENGEPLSEKFLFDTYEDCDKNLVLINFITQNTNLIQKSHLTPDPSPTLEAYP